MTKLLELPDKDFKIVSYLKYSNEKLQALLKLIHRLEDSEMRYKEGSEGGPPRLRQRSALNRAPPRALRLEPAPRSPGPPPAAAELRAG